LKKKGHKNHPPPQKKKSARTASCAGPLAQKKKSGLIEQEKVAQVISANA
jgi:hypothetical protein